MFERILLPTDGSEQSLSAATTALDLAAVHGATVHALYVVEPVFSTERAGPQLEAMHEAGQRAVEQVADGARERNVPAATAVQDGIPHREILAYADDSDIDLVVMGTHGRTGLSRYLIGSVAEKIVRLSDVPVLTVQTHDEGGD